MSETDKKKSGIDYRAAYEHYIAYEENLHEQNVKKIRTGIKINIFLPLIFLIISFLTSGSKLVFLILWILSLFGIAFYLIHVEYDDYKMRVRRQEFINKNPDEVVPDALIGDRIVDVFASVDEHVDAVHEEIDRQIDQRIENVREFVAERKEHVEDSREQMQEALIRTLSSRPMDDVSDSETAKPDAGRETSEKEKD